LQGVGIVISLVAGNSGVAMGNILLSVHIGAIAFVYGAGFATVYEFV